MFWPTGHHKTILITLLLNPYYLHCPVFTVFSLYSMYDIITGQNVLIVMTKLVLLAVP
jgi:hypothetical protein